MIVKVLGSGCSNCKTLERNTRQAVDELGNGAQVEKVEDIVKILEYKIMRTPALVVDEAVIMSGRVPSVDEIKTLILQHFNSSNNPKEK